MTQVDLDFAQYVRQRRDRENSPEHGGAAYAYQQISACCAPWGESHP